MENQKLPYLPLDIVEIIFLSLPMNSILRFTLLSKYWKSFLSSHQFQTKHHNLRITEGPTNLVIAPKNHEGDDNSEYRRFSFTHIDNESCEDCIDELPDIISSLNFPVDCQKPPRLLGSWNGLVALYDGRDRFMLWNPCTNKINKVDTEVPLLSRENDHLTTNLFGLCYNSTDDEYMGLIVEYYCNPERSLGQPRKDTDEESTTCYLVSFKSRKVEKSTMPAWYRIFDEHVGTIVHGNPHWLVRFYHEYLGVVADYPENIFFFDHADKSFKTMSFPKIESKKRSVIISGLSSVYAQLTVTFMTSDHEDGIRESYEIWQMKEYGIDNSWSKFLVIPYTPEIDVRGSLAPLAITRDGDIVVDTNGNNTVRHIEYAQDPTRYNEIMAYNPKNKTFTQTLVSSNRGQIAANVAYIPTLFSPNL